MKLGLLLALTGAALVLNISEGRIVSKCELKQKLQQVLPLPRKYGRYKDQILALVTCELERRSQLDSNLVTGNAVLPTAAARRTTQASEGNQTATVQDIDSTISSAPMINSTLPILRRKRWASMKDFRERSDKRQGKKGQGSDESHERKNSKEGHGSSETESHKMENHGVNKPTASSRTTEMSNGVSGNPRQKRDASSEEKGHKQRGHKKQGDKKRGKKGRGSDESEECDNSSEESHDMGNHGVNKPTASSRTTEMSNGVSGNPRWKRDASSEEKGHQQRGNKKQGDKKRGKKGRGSDESDNSSEESHEMGNHGVNKPTASSRTTEMSNGVSGNPRQKRDASSEEKGHKQRGNKKQGDKKRGKKGRGSDESEESDNSSEESHGMENHGVNKPTASSRTTEMSNGVSGNPRQKRDASSEEKGHKQRGHKKQGDKKRGKKERGSDESDESDNSSEESHDMENHAVNKPTESSRTTEMSNGVSGNPRQKRDASSDERGNKRRGKKGRDNKKRGDKRRGNKGRDSDESNESGESKQKNKKEKKPSKHSHESSSQEEYNMEQNQGPSNYFGLFQLSDSFFCDSGNGLSKNLCDTNCSAFIDDDITDDLECFAYKGYWRSILDEVSSSCSDQQDTYFDECE
ncbi:uncharacterized protein DDB_G0283697-like [Oryzias melastigma]|uniref:uncharacterized protein DDB_G0283697-like n=1 Tax=Oryzias melastigma TaxID=30732 RepID=UPI000CF815FA|nr:uncharacterized protein DDB_G0283697-like [Oryzias melastigma]